MEQTGQILLLVTLVSIQSNLIITAGATKLPEWCQGVRGRAVAFCGQADLRGWPSGEEGLNRLLPQWP